MPAPRLADFDPAHGHVRADHGSRQYEKCIRGACDCTATLYGIAQVAEDGLAAAERRLADTDAPTLARVRETVVALQHLSDDIARAVGLLPKMRARYLGAPSLESLPDDADRAAAAEIVAFAQDHGYEKSPVPDFVEAPRPNERPRWLRCQFEFLSPDQDAVVARSLEDLGAALMAALGATTLQNLQILERSKPNTPSGMTVLDAGATTSAADLVADLPPVSHDG